jgi:hypothetical protein
LVVDQCVRDTGYRKPWSFLLPDSIDEKRPIPLLISTIIGTGVVTGSIGALRPSFHRGSVSIPDRYSFISCEIADRLGHRMSTKAIIER